MQISIPADIANCIYYRDGQFLTAETMQIAADYVARWITLQNQSLYNPGWLMGLDVVAGDGNTLIVEPGTGIDSHGHFLILPGTGNVSFSVPAPGSTPCYLILRYPTIATATARVAPQPVNMAATLQIAADAAPPADAILLAEIFVDNGVMKVTDRRTRVTSRVLADVSPATARAASAAATTARQGSVDIPLGQLRTIGDHVDLPVFYVGPDTPAFTAPPRVVANVLGPRPYAVNVDKVDTVGFVLRVTVITSAAEQPDRLAADWVAIRTPSGAGP